MNPYASGRVVLREVKKLYPSLFPKYPLVVDVGCGDGGWMEAAAVELDAAVCGIDRAIHPNLGVGGVGVRPTLISVLDLNDPDARARLEEELLQANRQVEERHRKIRTLYDLAICVEVAEHLQPNAAEGLARILCLMAPLVVFSAAVPGQGPYAGPEDDPDDPGFHRNERPLLYWQELFSNRGFRCDDTIREQIAGEMDVDPWYRTNVFLAIQP